MKKGRKRITVGCILVFLQALAIIGNLKEGVAIYLDFTDPMVFLYDLIFLLSYYFVGIIGVILIACGAYARFRKPKEKKCSDDKKRRKSVQTIEEGKKEKYSSESLQLSSDNATTPMVEETSAPVTRRKPKKAVIILSIVCGLLVVALAITSFYIFYQGDFSSTPSKNKSDDPLYDWLLENGTLDDNGTSLVFKTTDEFENVYTLYYSTYNGYLQASYLEKQDAYEIITSLSLEKSDRPSRKVAFSCDVYDSEGRCRGVECRFSPYDFTRKTPIEFGDATGDVIHMPDYDEGERKAIIQAYDKMSNIAHSLAHENLCKILDWLNSTICPMADCSLYDLGYSEYK